MANLRTVFRKAGLRRFASRRGVAAAVVFLFGAAGILALLAANADTAAVVIEAESGTVTGNASIVGSAAGASGGLVNFGTPGTPPPGPLPFPSKTGPYVHTASSLCLDAGAAQPTTSTPVTIAACNSGETQNWTIQYTKYGASEIRAGGKCLTGTVPSTADTFTNAFLDTCNSTPEQLWLPWGDNSQVRNLKSTNTGANDLCLDTAGAAKTAGTRVGLGTCAAPGEVPPTQGWTRPAGAPYGNVFFNPYTTSPTKCMDLPAGSTTPGTQLQVWDCNQQFPQYMAFGFEATKDDRMKMLVMGQCIEAKDNGTADGTPVQINACSDNPAQDWLFVGIDDVSFAIKGRISGKCIDTDSGQVANSAKLVLKPCDPSAASQKLGDPAAAAEGHAEGGKQSGRNSGRSGAF